VVLFILGFFPSIKVWPCACTKPSGEILERVARQALSGEIARDVQPDVVELKFCLQVDDNLAITAFLFTAGDGSRHRSCLCLCTSVEKAKIVMSSIDTVEDSMIHMVRRLQSLQGVRLQRSIVIFCSCLFYLFFPKIWPRLNAAHLITTIDSVGKRQGLAAI
jgi:hypothetical protein